jgi:uncharacterized protein
MPSLPVPVPVFTIGLLILSNLFMTFAWYGHLKFKMYPLVVVILISWLIALARIHPAGPGEPLRPRLFQRGRAEDHPGGHHLSIFMVFSVLYLGEAIRWNHAVGFA